MVATTTDQLSKDQGMYEESPQTIWSLEDKKDNLGLQFLDRKLQLLVIQSTYAQPDKDDSSLRKTYML